MKLALGEIVSLADLEEGELRMICVLSSLFSESELKESKLTGPELRQITQLKLRFDNPLEHEVVKYDGEDSAPEELSKQEFLKQIRKFLGEVRFTQYLRAHDHEFEQLCQLTESSGLRPQIAMAVFEVQSAAMLESLQIREDNALRRKERRLQLDSIEQSARDAIQ